MIWTIIHLFAVPILANSMASFLITLAVFALLAMGGIWFLHKY